MPRATKIIPAADRKGGRIVDTLILTFAQRTAERGFLFGVNGTCVELDFAEPIRLRSDDALILDDGGLVEVVADAEPLLEARADPVVLTRLAWELGSRHVPIEARPNRLRLRRAPQIEELLQTYGAKVAAIDAPFEPDGGAPAGTGQDHHHDHHHDGHDHAQGHEHDHHDHDHEHKPR
jgi:urease accessory protein